MEQKSKKIDVKIIIIIIVTIIAIIEGIVIFASNKLTPGESKKETKSPLVSMAEIKTSNWLEIKQKNFKEIISINAETIENKGNIVTIYGRIHCKDIYGSGTDSQFEGKFEKKEDSNGNLLDLTTKYLKVGFDVLVEE